MKMPVVLLCFCLHYAMAGTRSFTLTLTWKIGAPDGVKREMIFVNDKFPGPTLYIKEGDNVQVEVVNKLPEETTVHFHGIEQYNTPESDGVPGITQLPIQPGESYVYRWTATQYGSYMYHGHTAGHIEDGLFGAIVINPKNETSDPFDKISDDSSEVQSLRKAEDEVQPLILMDWRHRTSKQSWDIQVKSKVESSACMDSILVNGKGAVYCWNTDEIEYFTNPTLKGWLAERDLNMTDKGCAPPEILHETLDLNSTIPANYSAIPYDVFHGCKSTQGSVEVIRANPDKKWLALDIISVAGIETFAFSIDQHPMWVYAVDGHYIEPAHVHAIKVANGERYSIFIKLDQEIGIYGIRVASISFNQLIDTVAALFYDEATEYFNEPYINQAGGKTSNDVVFLGEPQLVPYPVEFPSPPPKVNQTFIMDLDIAGYTYQWALNTTAYPEDEISDDSPPWLERDPDDIPSSDIVFKTYNNTWIDLIFIATRLNQPPHPIHKHGNKAFIIGRGEGEFPYSSVEEAREQIPGNFNLKTPPYRDTYTTLATLRGPTWLAVRYWVDNPGPWLIHCHIQSHIRGGMAAVILEGVDHWPGS